MSLAGLRAAAAELGRKALSPLRHHPARWVVERLRGFLWSKQREIADALVEHRKVAVPSCHTSGKSHLAGRIAAWWIDVHPAGEALVVTTATTGDQVKGVLWQEIAQAHEAGDLDGRINQREWWIGTRLVGVGRKPAGYNPTAFQGYHRRFVLAIIDEADGVPATLWEAIDSITSNENSRVLAIGNPVDATSHFAKICNGGEALGWHVIPISAFDTPNFTGEDVPDELRELLLSPVFVDEAKLNYGEDSAYYTSRVLGRHPKDSADAVIPLSWIEAAVRRWWDLHDDELLADLELTNVGVDVARGGDDRTVIAEICDHQRVVRALHRSNEDTGTETALLVAPWIRGAGTWATVDVIGVGSSPVDQLMNLGLEVLPFNGSEGTDKRDAAGVLGFVNKRSAAWWGLRERLHPQSGQNVALPPDERLIADLSTPKWTTTAGGKIKVETKDEIRQRLGRSPDDGDAVVYGFWPDRPPVMSLPEKGSHRHRGITDDLMTAKW